MTEMFVHNSGPTSSDITAKKQQNGGDIMIRTENGGENGTETGSKQSDGEMEALAIKTEEISLEGRQKGGDGVSSRDHDENESECETSDNGGKGDINGANSGDGGQIGGRRRSGDDAFVESLNNCLFNRIETPGDVFPLKISVAAEDRKRAEECLKDYNLTFTDALELTFANKDEADRAVRKLLDEGLALTFNYSSFISHPGNLFIKNLSDELINYDRLFEYFQSNSKYQSLVDINIFNSVEDDVFAILKFQNYLDVDYIIANINVNENPFNVNDSVPLYLNKYISKKERKLKYTDSSVVSENLNKYNTIVIENINDFLNNYNPDLTLVERFLSKFEIFNKIESIYFPVIQTSDNNFTFLNFGFINFEINDNLNINVLKCLYYLSNLSFEQFMKFSPEDAYNIEQDLCKADHPPSSDKVNLKLSIGQHKHNHYLYQYQTNQFLYLHQQKLLVKYLDLSMHNMLLNSFSRFVNYQETNIYVNNFPIIFENDDRLWEKFWLQFGDNVKSAKIIKPQFYSRKNEVELGKIGFVFYSDFRMALRAILLTNNKLINFKSFKKILVQTSFAIQKNNHNHQRPSLPTNYHQAHNPLNSYFKRFSLPTITDYNYYIPQSVPVPPTAPTGNSSDYINFYNPYMYQFNYPYVPFDKDLSPNEDPRLPENVSPPLNYYYQPYYQFPSSSNYPPLSTPPTSPAFKTKKTSKSKK